jgi:hypothetical protein
MVAAGMRESGRRAAVLAAATLALAAGGCGGERQDADAPSGGFELDVSDASFPARQRIAQTSTLRLEVENTGERAVPELAVTVETAPAGDDLAPVAFGQRSRDTTLSASARPIWILDEGPRGGTSAYANTWTLGPLGPGRTRSVRWRLTAAKAGRYTVAWRLAPSLEGDVTLSGGRTKGELDVTIVDEPVPARVGEGGGVVRGEEAGRE